MFRIKNLCCFGTVFCRAVDISLKFGVQLLPIPSKNACPYWFVSLVLFSVAFGCCLVRKWHLRRPPGLRFSTGEQVCYMTSVSFGKDTSSGLGILPRVWCAMMVTMMRRMVERMVERMAERVAERMAERMVGREWERMCDSS